MLHIINARDIHGTKCELSIPELTNTCSRSIDATGLTILPGLIDPHVHFRSPGLEYKEDWRTAAKAAIHGGYTMVFDMPNTIPATINRDLVRHKIATIDQQLQEVGIPLRYKLFFGADANYFAELPLLADPVIGIKVFMGCSTGNLLMNSESLPELFKIAAKHQLLVAVHAEDEQRIRSRQQQFSGTTNYSDHSRIRDVESACIAVQQAIELAQLNNVRLYILHVSSAAELNLIKGAKQKNLTVYAETTPHHLFLNDSAYATLQGRAVVNPPLRTTADNQALWDGINDGTIDTIGSDHAPHTIAEKNQPYPLCPSGMPGIETTLPLLLNAYNQGRISLARIVRLTVQRVQEIFNLPTTADYVLVDLQKSATVNVSNLHSKCGWSAVAGQTLTGWPVYTIVNGVCFKL
jgi:dihydroorotase